MNRIFIPGKKLLAVAGLAGFLATLQAAGPLVWDSEVKEATAQTNQAYANIFFSVTNVSKVEVVIDEVQPSCGCTVVSLPASPWKLAPGAGGRVEIQVDLAGKSGVLIKTLTVRSSVGVKDLVFKVKLPDTTASTVNLAERVRRLRNQRTASGDRQAVFKGDCARCHVPPATAKTGGELFQAACAICHDGPHRASMVPELSGLPQGQNPKYWSEWIAHGREGSLMPAFARASGGPLSDEQIQSLTSFLVERHQAGLKHPPPGSAPALPRP